MAENHWFWHWKANHKKPSSFNKFFRPSPQPRQTSPASGRITNKLVSETFWPDTIDKECDKASRILHSFCKHGMIQDEAREDSSFAIQKQKAWIRVPEEVLANAKGIVIFTAMRPGLWVSGAGGSGLVLARTSDGSWSWPVAIEIHTAELGFLVGVDIYDCLLVLNTHEAVDAFAKSRCIIGGDLYAIPGPLGVGWFFSQKDNRSKHAPIFSYLRSRGYYAAVQMDHAIVLDRSEENKRFYESSVITTKDILTGQVSARPSPCSHLLATLRACEGKPVAEAAPQPAGPPPSDFEVVEEGHTFGVPDKEDPDPFGVLALEKQGFLIKEAGTKTSPTTDTFDFNPSVTSPIYGKYNRRSSENPSPRSSWRRSVMSSSDRRAETNSIISNNTDQDSEAPPSPGYSNLRHSQGQDGFPISPYTRHSRSNSNSRNTLSEGDLANKNVLHSKSPMSMSGPETIYEDESADVNDTKEVSDIMDRMVDMLQGGERVREKKLSPPLQASASFDPSQPSIQSDLKPEPLRIDTSQNDLEETSPDETPDKKSINDEEVKPEEVETKVHQADHAAKSDEHIQDKKDNLDDHVAKSDEPGLDKTDNLDDKVETDDEDNHDGDSDGEFESLTDLDDEADSPVEIHDAVIHGGPAPVTQSVATVSMPKARIVTVTKPAAPALPTRNPGRLQPSSSAASIDERSQVAPSADPEFTQSSHQDGKSSTQPSTSVSPSADHPVSPISTPSEAKPTLSEAPEHKPTSLSIETVTNSLPANSTTTPPTSDETKEPSQINTLANMRQNLNSSPSPISPEESKDYFA